jgi:hypothetical protein
MRGDLHVNTTIGLVTLLTGMAQRNLAVHYGHAAMGNSILGTTCLF